MSQSYATFNNKVDDDNTFFGALSKGLQQTSQLKAAEAQVQTQQLHNLALQQMLGDHAQDHALQNQMLEAQIQQHQAAAQLASRTVDSKVLQEELAVQNAKSIVDSRNLDMQTALDMRPGMLQAQKIQNQYKAGELEWQSPLEGAKLHALDAQTEAQKQHTDFEKQLYPQSLALGWNKMASSQAEIARVKAETEQINQHGLMLQSQLRGSMIDKSLKVIAAVSAAPPGTRAGILNAISSDDPELGELKKHPELFEDNSFQATLNEALMKDPRTAAQTLLLSKGLKDAAFPLIGPDGKPNLDTTKSYRDAFKEIITDVTKRTQETKKQANDWLSMGGSANGATAGKAAAKTVGGLFYSVAPQEAAQAKAKTKDPSQATPTAATDSPTANTLMDVLGRNDQHFKGNDNIADEEQPFANFKIAPRSDDDGPVKYKKLYDSVNSLPAFYSPLQPGKSKKNEADVYDGKEYPYPSMKPDPVRSQIDNLVEQGYKDAKTYRSAATNTTLLLAIRKAMVTGEDPKPILRSFMKSPYLNDLDQLQRERLNQLTLGLGIAKKD